VPVAVTLKVTSAPAGALWPWGWLVMAGSVCPKDEIAEANNGIIAKRHFMSFQQPILIGEQSSVPLASHY
jgi:hypothetical protein